ncbi:hypothetical protein GCM10023347_14480 [Streptomyces chumphonensis]
MGAWQRADLGAALGEPPGRDWVVHGLALGADGPPPAPDASGARAAPGPTGTPPPQEPHPC